MAGVYHEGMEWTTREKLLLLRSMLSLPRPCSFEVLGRARGLELLYCFTYN